MAARPPRRGAAHGSGKAPPPRTPPHPAAHGRPRSRALAGNLPRDATEDEFKQLEEDLRADFEKFGRVTKVWVAKKPAGFGE